jgi:hypothetical protein
MSQALRQSAEASALCEPEIGVVAKDTELHGELDRLLARKPVAKPSGAGLRSANANHAFSESSTAEVESFDWEPDVDAAANGNSGATAASAAWLAKARSDKRSSSRHNVAAWIVTLVIGAAILAASAYFLIGWRPDFSAALASAKSWIL